MDHRADANGGCVSDDRPAEIFTIFFVTLGPLKILRPFAQRTRDLDDATMRKVSVLAFLIAAVAVGRAGYSSAS